MIITCEECSTSFNLDDRLIKPSGSKVRCSKCKHVFVAFPEAVPEEAPPPEESPLAEEKEAPGDESLAESAAETGMAMPASGLLTEDQTDVSAADAAASDDLDLDMDAVPEEDAAQDTPEQASMALDKTLELDTPTEADVADDLLEDLDLDMEPEPASLEGKAAPEPPEEEDLDLSALDEALEMEAEPDERAASEPSGAEEDLDLDMAMNETAAPFDVEAAAEKQPAAEKSDEEELDLSSLDEALDTDAEPEVTPPAGKAADALDDLELEIDSDLELEMEGESASADELDMSDLKLELEDEEEAVPPAETAELEADLEMEEKEDAPEEAAGEIDMAGFVETLEMDAPPKVDSGDVPAGDDLEDLELELDLEMEGETPPEKAPAPSEPPSADAEEEVEELDFELDMEFEPGEDLAPTGLEMETDSTEDLDLSDIEEMLEVKEKGADGEDVGEADAKATEVEKWKVTPGADDDLMEETAEIDLSDIQLDADDLDDEEIEDRELDLDISDDVVAATDGAGAKVSAEPEELDISHFEDLEMEEKVSGAALGEGDIELEFEIEEGSGRRAAAAAAAADAAEPTQDFETIEITDRSELEAGGAPVAAASKEKPEKKEKKKKAKKKKTKKTRPVGKSSPAKPVLVVLLLLVVAFAAVVVLDRYGIQIPYVTEYVRQVPYVNELLPQEIKKTGEITTSNISSRFVDNEKHGKFFVISGMVKNEYPESRRFIQLTGRLFATGKTLVKEETIYCGNTLSDVQLTMMDLMDIDKKLQNRLGDNKSNVDVRPGQQIPFMLVFSELPQDLEEFTIEVSNSLPVQP